MIEIAQRVNRGGGCYMMAGIRSQGDRSVGGAPSFHGGIHAAKDIHGVA
jgi:hypothetical protein